MAKKYSVSAQVNGASAQTKDVIVSTQASIGSPEFLYRVWLEFSCADNDELSILSVGASSTVNDPMGGFSQVPFFEVITHSGGITLSFID